MIPATRPVQRRADAKLLVVDSGGAIVEAPRSRLTDYLFRGDLVVANDAATLPASLSGTHRPTCEPVEVRLAARVSLAGDDVAEFSAVVFGAGDFRTRTEDRLPPPPLESGDVLDLGPLQGTVVRTLGHPRFVRIRFAGSADEIWRGIAVHGRPIQYAHLSDPLALWDVWTSIAGRPAAFEPPSAGFVLDWSILARFHAAGVEFATITHAAGISSTGDPDLDARLPLDEPYDIPAATAGAIEHARSEGRRIVAIGTTVVRAVEHAASGDGVVRAGMGIATKRIGPRTLLRVVDAVLSGVHEPDTSHYQLLRAFIPDDILRRADEVMLERGFRTHEFGDSVLIARSRVLSSSVFISDGRGTGCQKEARTLHVGAGRRQHDATNLDRNVCSNRVCDRGDLGAVDDDRSAAAANSACTADGAAADHAVSPGGDHGQRQADHRHRMPA